MTSTVNAFAKPVRLTLDQRRRNAAIKAALAAQERRILEECQEMQKEYKAGRPPNHYDEVKE